MSTFRAVLAPLALLIVGAACGGGTTGPNPNPGTLPTPSAACAAVAATQLSVGQHLVVDPSVTSGCLRLGYLTREPRKGKDGDRSNIYRAGDRSVLDESVYDRSVLDQSDQTSSTDLDYTRVTDLSHISASKSYQLQKDLSGSNTHALPLIPLKDKSDFLLSDEQLSEFQKAYPRKDIVHELQQMRIWSLSNPTKMKTKAGVLKFMNSWLSRNETKSTSNQSGMRQSFQDTVYTGTPVDRIPDSLRSLHD